MQREMPFFASLGKPEFVPHSLVTGWSKYRDSVVWCWTNRKRNSLSDSGDQAAFARFANVHAPHMARYVGRTKAPMDLKPDLIACFESWTGWKGPSQWIASQSGETIMEQVIAERAA